MVGFILATLVAIFFSVYFLVIQYYVLLVEVILMIIIMVCNVFELLLGFFSCWQFQSYEKQQWSNITKIWKSWAWISERSKFLRKISHRFLYYQIITVFLCDFDSSDQLPYILLNPLPDYQPHQLLVMGSIWNPEFLNRQIGQLFIGACFKDIQFHNDWLTLEESYICNS